MSAIRVIILYKDSVDSISVDGDDMLDLSAIQNKPIEAWFEPSGGRDGWEGLIKEVQKQAGDEDAEFSFEFHGPQESKMIFEDCIRQRGFGVDALSKEEIIDENMKEAIKAEHRGLHSKAYKCYKNAAAYGIPEAQFKVAEYYYRRFRGEDIGIDMKPQDAIGDVVDFYEKAAKQNHIQAQRRLYELFSKGEGVNQNWDEAIHWLQAAAQCGDAEAGKKLAWHYRSGTGVQEDNEQAFFTYSALAKAGDAEAQYESGNCCNYGVGTQEDKEAAFEWYRKSAIQGYARAQYELGQCHKYGRGTPADAQASFEWHKKSAEQGCADAQYELGQCYKYGSGTSMDDQAAFEWYKKSAEQGHADAQYELGQCYFCGWGVQADEQTAFAWYKKSAEQGIPTAQLELGRCYAQGNGIEKDMAAAAEWYRKAAEQEEPLAQYYLGDCYDAGEGVQADKESAVEWYKKAAEHGHAEAQYRLGDYYSSKLDEEEEDLHLAALWYEKAATAIQGHIAAQRKLGLCYAEGKGVEEDPDTAVMWIRKAAEAGDVASQDWLGAYHYYGTCHLYGSDSDARWFSGASSISGDQNYDAALYWYKEVVRTLGAPFPDGDILTDNAFKEHMATWRAYGQGQSNGRIFVTLRLWHACRQIVAIYERQLNIEREDQLNPVANMKAVKGNDKKYKKFLQTKEGRELLQYCWIGAEAGDGDMKKKRKRLKKILK